MDMTSEQAGDILRWLFLGVGIVNLLLALVWAFRRRILHKPTFAPVWSLLDVWMGAQATLALIVFLATPVILLGMFSPRFSGILDATDPRALPLIILQNIAFFAVPAGFILLKYGKPLRDIGLPPLPRRRDVYAGILLGLLVIVVGQILGTLLQALATHFQNIPWVRNALLYEQTNPVAKLMANLSKAGTGALILGVIAIGVSAPLGEEMFMRGFLFNALKRRFGVAAGIVLSALLFTLPHTYALGLLPVFLMGMLLAWVYHNSGSLWTSIIVHAMNNTIVVLLAYFFPSLSK